MFAEVAVNLPVEGTFHYHIPPALNGQLKTGHLVEVSFGRQKAQGIVLRLTPDSPVPETKPILRLVDHRPVITPRQLAFAR
ncbi:MAG TPA: hypothetical protein PKI52_14505, partial [Aggregatilineales bacterium]|nr:hypothetical protein [Aggregatilineales bacterium]